MTAGHTGPHDFARYPQPCYERRMALDETSQPKALTSAACCVEVHFNGALAPQSADTYLIRGLLVWL